VGAAKRNDIQWLRALAAIEVVLWHSDLVTKHFSTVAFQLSSYRLLGGMGVELFFIISGYVICLQSPRYRTALSFLYARYARLLPMYWIFTSLVVLVYFLNPSWRLGSFDLGPTTYIKSYLILPQYKDPILGVGWSLEHEVIFYVAVASLIGVGFGSIVRQHLTLAVALAALGVIGLALATGPQPLIWDFQISSPYMLLFAFGWTMCCIHQRYINPRGALIALTCTGLIALLVAAPKEQMLAVRIVLLAAVFATFVSARSLLERDTILNRAVSSIADASYSLYLSHWFILSALGKVLGVLKIPPGLDIPARLAALAACILCALVIFRYIEKPIDQLLRPRQAQNKSPAAVGPAAYPNSGE